MSKKVTIFGVFKEDGRISMELYAAFLEKLLDDNPKYDANIFEPKITSLTQKLPLNNLNQMRIARYWDYPRQCKALKNDSDIYHIADHGYAHLINQLPKEKTLITVHDLIPIVAYHGKIKGMDSHRKPALALASARKLKEFEQIIAMSENSKNDIINYCNVDPNRVKVIYYGLAPYFTPDDEEDDNQLAQYNFSDKPIILSSGSSIYKNTRTVLNAFKLISEKHDAELVHIGPEYEDHANYAFDLGLKNKTRFLGKVPFNHLKALYRKANHLIFPSLYEGFGLPPLEAMACGCPAIVSDRASLPEVVGDAALICDAFDIEAIAHYSEKLLLDSAFRKKMVERSLTRAEFFNWNSYREKLLEVYKNY